jgi:hypothetical protein
VRGSLCSWLVAVTAVLVSPASAAELVASVETAGPFTVGDSIVVTVSARGGAAGWLWGDLEVTPEPDGAWEVLALEAVDGAEPPAWTVRLAPMRLGDLALPKMEVTARTPERRAIVLGEQSQVEVVSVLDDAEAAEPAPLRGPIGVAGLPWEWVLPFLIPLMIGAAAGLLWRRRHRAQAACEPPEPPLEELEHALAAASDRLGRDEDVVVCDRLATALRRFVERRTGEPATDMTSHEIRVTGRRSGWPQTCQRALDRVLSTIDGARFAKRPLPPGALEAAIGQLRDGARALDAGLQAAEAEEAA